LLAKQPDNSVTIVSVGFLTNLAAILDSRPDEHSPLDGEALVAKKVRQWVCMGGVFPQGKFQKGQGEYNFMYDTVASVRAINDWPTPVVFSGFAIFSRTRVLSALQRPEGPRGVGPDSRALRGSGSARLLEAIRDRALSDACARQPRAQRVGSHASQAAPVPRGGYAARRGR